MFKIGLSKVKIDVPIIPVAMKGYGDWNNRVEGKKTDLHVRTFIVSNNKEILFFTNVEILVITARLKREVLHKIHTDYPEISLSDDNFMLTAQHTHSAPSGYSEYAFHTFTTPGISKEVISSYRDAIVASVVEASKSMFSGVLTLKHSTFDTEIPVAWNRSITSYNQNHGIDKVKEDQTHLALDRSMTLLEIKEENGELKGSINWFGVHTTSVGPKNTLISFDNKGYAADFLEKKYPNTVHVFAQGKAGDVSPHFHGKNQVARRKQTRKKGDHSYAEQHGELQFAKAKEILETKDGVLVSNSDLDFVTRYFDFTNIAVSSKYTGGVENCKTGDACIGAAMFKGTPVDGPGISGPVAGLFSFINRLVNKKAKELKEVHGNKEIILNASKREFLGLGRLNVFPKFVDSQIKITNKMAKIGAVDEHSLVPTVLPIQLFLIGNLALASIPIEITTVAGKRLEASVLESLKDKGIDKIILCPYANSYAGYVTTPEEYEVQNYEGGHTIFGKWTLGAFQTTFDKLANQLYLEKEARKVSGIDKVPVFSKDQLAKRTYPFT